VTRSRSIIADIEFPLGPKPIRVQFVKSLKDPDCEDGSQMFGHTLMDENLIQINVREHASIDHICSTLFHELIHAYFSITGQNQTLSHEQEESIVRMLESMLFWLVDKSLLTSLLPCDTITPYLKRGRRVTTARNS
jgi:hypothetical protein